MEQPINEKFLKLSSKVSIAHTLELGDDVTVVIDSDGQLGTYIFNVVKKEENDNQDGTVDVTYVAKALTD